MISRRTATALVGNCSSRSVSTANVDGPRHATVSAPSNTLRNASAVKIITVSRDQPAMSFRLIAARSRSEEHTSELQSRENLVCRLLLEKKKEQDAALRPRASRTRQCRGN